MKRRRLRWWQRRSVAEGGV